MNEYFDCPVCGEEVKHGALSCPGCGACDETGWKDDHESNINLPDDDFDYDAYIAREFDGKPKQTKKENIVALVALALVIIWVLYYVLWAKDILQLGIRIYHLSFWFLIPKS